MKNWFKNHMPTQRRLIQLYTALLYNANIKGFADGQIYTGQTKNICVPGFNCYSCPGAVGACPLGALQNALASSNARAPYYVLGLLMLFGLTLGRVICGFLCPLGLLQELLYKIPTPKAKKSRVSRVFSYMKYVILAIFVVIIPLAYSLQSFPVPAFCKYICPAGTFEGAIGLLSNPVNADKFSMLNILFTRKFVILIALAVSSVFIYRFFCRFICPLGAIYGLFAKVALLGVKVDKTACTDCGLCVRECKMDIKHVGDHECIQCGHCISSCPTKAISWKGSKIFLKDNEATKKETPVKKNHARGIAWALALCVLGGALWYFNRPVAAADVTPEPIPIEEDDSTPVGMEVGMRCPDFTVTTFGGETFSLKEKRGSVVVLNFWATWCTPCCNELPFFQQLSDTYKDTVSVLALHSSLVTDDASAYVNKQGYTMPFALDETGNIIASLGGSTMLPMTVILDKNGIIVYNKVGSVTYAQLESLISGL